MDDPVGSLKCSLTCSAANQAEVRVMRRGEGEAEGVTLQTIQSQFVEVGDVILLREGEQVYIGKTKQLEGETTGRKRRRRVVALIG